MYELGLKQSFQNAKVRDLIKALQTLPPDADILCDGDEWFWLHVETDSSVVDIDSASLEDEYEVDDQTTESEEENRA